MQDFAKEKLAVDQTGPLSAEHYGPVRWLVDDDGSSVGMAWGHTQDVAAARADALVARWNACAKALAALNDYTRYPDPADAHREAAAILRRAVHGEG